MTKCQTEALPRLAGPTGAEFDKSQQGWESLYTDCAARHNGLIDDINKRQELSK